MRDNKLYVECENEERNRIGITTNVTIRSSEEDSKEIDQLFGANSVFINESRKLLSELFGLPVSFEEVVTNNNNKYGVDE